MGGDLARSCVKKQQTSRCRAQGLQIATASAVVERAKLLVLSLRLMCFEGWIWDLKRFLDAIMQDSKGVSILLRSVLPIT